MSKEHIIYKVTPGSIAEELEIEAGDVLVSVNGKEIEDVFDFHYAVNDEYLEILIRKADGEEWELEIEKENNKYTIYHCMDCYYDSMDDLLEFPRGDSIYERYFDYDAYHRDCEYDVEEASNGRVIADW